MKNYWLAKREIKKLCEIKPCNFELYPKSYRQALAMIRHVLEWKLRRNSLEDANSPTNEMNPDNTSSEN